MRFKERKLMDVTPDSIGSEKERSLAIRTVEKNAVSPEDLSGLLVVLGLITADQLRSPYREELLGIESERQIRGRKMAPRLKSKPEEKVRRTA